MPLTVFCYRVTIFNTVQNLLWNNAVIWFKYPIWLNTIGKWESRSVQNCHVLPSRNGYGIVFGAKNTSVGSRSSVCCSILYFPRYLNLRWAKWESTTIVFHHSVLQFAKQKRAEDSNEQPLFRVWKRDIVRLRVKDKCHTIIDNKQLQLSPSQIRHPLVCSDHSVMM